VKYGMIALAALAISIPVITMGIDRALCAAHWDGFKTTYSVVSGCKVEIDGMMVPQANVRIGQ